MSYQVPMRRIGLAVVLALSLVLALLVTAAQPTGKVPRIGIVALPRRDVECKPMPMEEAFSGASYTRGRP